MKVDELIVWLEEYRGKDTVVCLPDRRDIGWFEIDEESNVIRLMPEEQNEEKTFLDELRAINESEE